MRFAQLFAGVVLLGLALNCGGRFARSDTGPESSDEARVAELKAHIADLISQMGAEQYVRREKAQQKLRRLGVTAFDALLEAQQHEDIEIASRARYLLRRMPIRWAHESDTAEVKSLLRNYGDGSRSERKNRMEQLASLEKSEGIPALCRLARFEVDPILSKQAALLVIQHLAPETPVLRTALAAVVRETVAVSRRSAAHWLATYARTLEEPETTLLAWADIAKEETVVLARFPEETDRQIVRDLSRWRAELLLRLGRDGEALEVMRPALQLVENDRRELLDIVDWSLEQKAWAVTDELAGRFPDEFRNDALLLYRWAEAQRGGGDDELSEKTALEALQIEPERHDRHIETAKSLSDRMLYEWSERELRHVLDVTEPTEIMGMESRLCLSNMLFDLEQEGESAELLKTLVEANADDPKILLEYGFSPESLQSVMHYRFAVHFSRLEDREKQRDSLEQALQANPEDLDVLIAMHRMPDAGEVWRKDTVQRIRVVAGRLRDLARQYESIIDDPTNHRVRPEILAPLASMHNQYAWLVCNTEGDLDEALRSSRRSLELVPNTSAYLDTLGRCYYALGDLDSAVKYQTRAVQLEPQTQQIRRQLDLFRSALARQAADPATSP